MTRPILYTDEPNWKRQAPKAGEPPLPSPPLTMLLRDQLTQGVDVFTTKTLFCPEAWEELKEQIDLSGDCWLRLKPGQSAVGYFLGQPLGCQDPSGKPHWLINFVEVVKEGGDLAFWSWRPQAKIVCGTADFFRMLYRYRESLPTVHSWLCREEDGSAVLVSQHGPVVLGGIPVSPETELHNLNWWARQIASGAVALPAEAIFDA